MPTRPTPVLILALLAGCVVAAQTATEPGPTVAMLEQRLAAYRHLMSDWAGLTRYGSEDSEVPPPAAGENRVVFIGDQITERLGPRAGGVLSRQALLQSRHRRPDGAADAGPLPPGRDRAEAAGGGHPRGEQRHCRRHGPRHARVDVGSHHVDDRAGESPRHPRGARVDHARVRLHRAADGSAASAQDR